MKLKNFFKGNTPKNEETNNNEEEFDDDEDIIYDEEIDSSEPMPEMEGVMQISREELSEILGSEAAPAPIMVSFGAYLGRKIDMDVFNRCIFVAWEANRNSDLGYIANDKGHLIAPVEFWDTILNFVNFSEAQKPTNIGFKTTL